MQISNYTTVICVVVAVAVVLALFCIVFGCTSHKQENQYSQTILEKNKIATIYDIGYTSIKGEAKTLGAFKGQVLLIANVASKCGYTPQYKGLEAVYQKYQGQGLVILGFPCNQFLSQEPGNSEEIAQFCQVNYGVSFPLATKIEVNGPDKHPLYAYLTNDKAAFPGKIGWNFTKFLVNRQGTVVARFGSSTVPESPEVIAAIETALKEVK